MYRCCVIVMFFYIFTGTHMRICHLQFTLYYKSAVYTDMQCIICSKRRYAYSSSTFYGGSEKRKHLQTRGVGFGGKPTHVGSVQLL